MSATNIDPNSNAPVEATNQATPQPETEAPTQSASPEQEPPSHRAFAKLAELEKSNRMQRKRTKELEATNEKNERLFQLAKTNPVEFLKATGVSLQDVLTDEVNKGELPVEEQLRREVNQLREEQRQLQEQQRQQTVAKEEAKYNELYNQFVDGVKQFVDNSPELELIGLRDAYGTVAEVISQYYNETGEELPVGDAAKLVEQELHNDAQSYLKGSKLGKQLRDELSDEIRKELEAQAQASRQANNPNPTGRLRTLTNDQQATQSVRSQGILPMDEAKKRAAALLRFNPPE